MLHKTGGLFLLPEDLLTPQQDLLHEVNFHAKDKINANREVVSNAHVISRTTKQVSVKHYINQQRTHKR
jgi:hypothetical protein